MYNEQQDREMNILIRESINQSEIEREIIVIKPVDNTIKPLIYKFLPSPEWLQNPLCYKCNQPASPSTLFNSGVAVLVQDGINDPKPYCDKCRIELDNKDYIYVNEKPKFAEDEEIKFVGKVEWTVNSDKWYFINSLKIVPYLPYASSPEAIRAKFIRFVQLLNKSNTVNIKAKYIKEEKKLLVNISSFY